MFRKRLLERQYTLSAIHVSIMLSNSITISQLTEECMADLVISSHNCITVGWNEKKKYAL